MTSMTHGELVEAGPRFFGTMTASVAHEIKNVLAIINENAGLLDDLALMHEQGSPLAPERMRRIAGNILQQVQRADTIVRYLSRFAHSADERCQQVALHEVVELVLALAGRLAGNRGISLEAAALPASAATVRTSPFQLEMLLWRCLDSAMGMVDGKKTIHVKLAQDGEANQVILAGLAWEDTASPLSGSVERALEENLGASVRLDAQQGGMVITLKTCCLSAN